MQLTFRQGLVEVDMQFYVEKILSDYGELKLFATPATKELFVANDDDEMLDDERKKSFHTTVARLLYLSKRARPDILVAVGFLSTRVKGPTITDERKLLRVLGYLESTREKVLRLKPKKIFALEAFIDASFSAHLDGKSHSGVVMLVAGVPVYCSSKKQKCVSKSPTEAELVALSDNVSLIELFQELLEFLLNMKPPKAIAYQDNTSVISLVTKGGGVMRTKHMRTRMNLVMESVMKSKIIVRYISTVEMVADGFTKALVGEPFQYFVKTVLGDQTLNKSASERCDMQSTHHDDGDGAVP